MMQQHTSNSSGWLALVATPIGNLQDITLRALDTLRDADLIAAEDTRRARKLLTHFDIHCELTAYHAHNEHRRTQQLLDGVCEGRKVVVLSDAGTPAISDPGFLVVREALKRNIEPVVIPGVSALTFAVVAAGLPVDKFAFLGFPPVKSGKRRTFIESIPDYHCTVFLYESTHRIQKLIAEIAEILGPHTPMAIIREATKLHEECIRGTAGEISENLDQHSWRGEFVVGVSCP